MSHQGEVAMILEYDHKTQQSRFVSYTPLDNLSDQSIYHAYLSATDDPKLKPHVDAYFSQLSVSVPLYDSPLDSGAIADLLHFPKPTYSR